MEENIDKSLNFKDNIDSNEDFQNNLLQSDIQEENNLINYEINNEDDKYQNDLVSSNRFNENDFNEINNDSENNNSNEINSDNLEINNNLESGEENGQDEEMALITLNAIAICQCCKSNFNNEKNVPYLFKCGHFFCIDCINNYFKDESGIICPLDGLIAKSINELKLLKNLITNNKVENINCNDENSNILNEENSLMISDIKKNDLSKYDKDSNNKYCLRHDKQKLTHINCETNKLLCIYCAFELLKQKPKAEIKEIKEKAEEYKANVSSILDSVKRNLEEMKLCLKKFKKLKEEEENKINNFYTTLIEYLKNKQNMQKENLNKLYENNMKEIQQNIECFNEIINKGNYCEKLLNKLNKDDYIIFDIIDNYNSFYNLFKSKNNVDKYEYIIFKANNEKEVLNYLNNIGEMESKYEFLNNTTFGIKDSFIDNNNDNNFGQSIKRELNFSNNLNNNFIDKINEYSCNVNFDKYTFPKNRRQIKEISIHNDNKNNFNAAYLNETKYKTITSNNTNNGQDMPIRDSYLFHQKTLKNNNNLKKYEYEDIFKNILKENHNYNSKTNRINEVKSPFLKSNYNNNFLISNNSKLTRNLFPYDFRYNKMTDFK